MAFREGSEQTQKEQKTKKTKNKTNKNCPHRNVFFISRASGTGADVDTDTDIDTDEDADTGADTDAGTDTDTGADADADAGADAGAGADKDCFLLPFLVLFLLQPVSLVVFCAVCLNCEIWNLGIGGK